MTEEEDQSDSDPPWDDAYHPDIIITESQIPNIKGRIETTPISDLEELYEGVEDVLQMVVSDEPSHNERLLAAYHRQKHRISGLSEDEADTGELLIEIWDELTKATFDEDLEGLFGDELEDNRDELKEGFAEQVFGREIDDITLSDLVAFLEQNIETLQQQQNNPSITILDTDAFQILTYFTANVSLLESRASWILHEEFINEEFKQQEQTWDLIRGPSGLSQEQREQWLLRTGIIDSGLHSKMKDARIMRNNLVHEPHAPKRIEASPEEIKNTASRGLEAAKELTKIMEEALET
jgi:hypothetical protein